MLRCEVAVGVGTVLQTSKPVKSASLQAVLVMASGSSSFQDRNQPLLSFATTAEMLVVCQTCYEEKRFLAAASLPVALNATSYLLFLSRIEQCSAFLAPKVVFFLYLPCWQRTTKVAKPFKMGKQEQRGEMMDGAGRLFLAAASLCCSLSLLDKLPVIHCTITQL